MIGRREMGVGYDSSRLRNAVEERGAACGGQGGAMNPTATVPERLDAPAFLLHGNRCAASVPRRRFCAGRHGANLRTGERTDQGLAWSRPQKRRGASESAFLAAMAKDTCGGDERLPNGSYGPIMACANRLTARVGDRTWT